MKKIFLTLLTSLLSLSFIACSQENPSFSLLEDSDSFAQETNGFNGKMDILWVIDNSRSMSTSQTNVANNFQTFINDFLDKGFDFKITVTTTEAYKTHFTGDQNISIFRDGTDATSHTGVFVITPQTPNLVSTFFINVIQGVTNSGDERAFHSFQEALDNPSNAGFLRDDSFLSIIIVSDEDDFSHDGDDFDNDYTNPDLYTVQSYVDYLEQLTGTAGANRRFNVSAMAIFDEACKDFLDTTWMGRKVGVRYGELVDATEGIKGSLCDSFSDSLKNIANNIISLATQFYLSRVPIPSTIKVIVDGQVVPKASQNTGSTTGGWTYKPESNSIIFTGNHIPQQGANIDVNYDPVNYGS